MIIMASAHTAANLRAIATATLLTGLAGCVAVPMQQPGPPLLVAYPAQGKPEPAFREDDTLCRTASGQTPAPGTELSPGQIYLRCMASRGNIIQPVQGSQQVAYAQPATYAYDPPFPIYAAYDGYYPWLYGGYLGGGFGFGGYRGGYDRGGYGAFRDGSFRDGGFHGGGFDGGFHGGGFGGGRR
jgi:hypothetical protein